MNWKIVRKSDLAIVHSYEGGESPTQYGGPWGEIETHIHVPVEGGLDPDAVHALHVEADPEAEPPVLEHWVLETDTDLANVKVEKLWKQLRAERDRKLSSCDWIVLSDSPASETCKTAYIAYRQALRDLPSELESPISPIWPEEPEYEKAPT